MRHLHFLNGTRKVYDGQYRCPLVVVGQRNEAHVRPAKPGDDASAEEKAAYAQRNANHQRRITSGFFSETTLEWCQTQEEAAVEIAKFIAPEWINVRVEPVSKILEHSQP